MNTLGRYFKVHSFGESHGPVIGVVIDGCPAGLQIDTKKMQEAVLRRRTAQNEFSSARKEEDQIQIRSGVFEGKTTGAPILLLIENQDSRPEDYDQLKDVYRPGHADVSYDLKYGFRDHRGGGRSSVRITAAWVAAGDLARQVLQHYQPTEVLAYVSSIGTCSIPAVEGMDISTESIEASAFRCPHPETSKAISAQIEEVRLAGDTLGGTITCRIQQAGTGLGEPVFGKLQAELAHAMMAIPSVKGFEYGEGFAAARMKGSEHNDPFVVKEGAVHTSGNHSGGILGGISNGMDIDFRVAFKPISSIQLTQKTLDKNLKEQQILIKGRHDVCAVPRAVPIVEALTYIVLINAFLNHKLSRI